MQYVHVRKLTIGVIGVIAVTSLIAVTGGSMTDGNKSASAKAASNKASSTAHKNNSAKAGSSSAPTSKVGDGRNGGTTSSANASSSASSHNNLPKSSYGAYATNPKTPFADFRIKAVPAPAPVVTAPVRTVVAPVAPAAAPAALPPGRPGPTIYVPWTGNYTNTDAQQSRLDHNTNSPAQIHSNDMQVGGVDLIGGSRGARH